MRGIDELTGSLARLAGWKWLGGTFAACAAAAAGIVRVAASYGIADAPDRGYAYTGAEAFALLGRLGFSGRQGLLLLHAFDYLYIVAYALFFGIAVAGIARRWRPSSAGLRRLAVLPVLAAVADLFENVCVDAAVLAFPKRPEWLLDLAGGFTTLKATLLPLVQALIVLGLAALAARALLSRMPTRPPAPDGTGASSD